MSFWLSRFCVFTQESGEWPGRAGFAHAEERRQSREEHPAVRGAAGRGNSLELETLRPEQESTKILILILESRYLISFDL